MKLFNTLIFSSVAALFALPAMSATVSLVPSSTSVEAGQAFTVDLVMDASDAPGNQPGSFRGSVLVDFGSLASYTGFTYNDPAVAFGATTETPTSITLGFDQANGVGTIGTFSFVADGVAGDSISLSIQDGVPFVGSFFNTDPTVSAFEPEFLGADITIVPIPAAAWLLIGGLGALGGFARRRA